MKALDDGTLSAFSRALVVEVEVAAVVVVAAAVVAVAVVVVIGIVQFIF